MPEHSYRAAGGPIAVFDETTNHYGSDVTTYPLASNAWTSVTFAVP
jgi:hypothetical protein